MPNRTTQTVVRFSSSFLLPNFNARQPPGDYRIEEDAELVEGISWLAYRRTATFIHLPAIAAASGTHRMVQIDPVDLEAALENDRSS
ncbi:hypothetical protein MRS76_25105 [Rhizobiaceae bacterium n13]|uniref:hypothetical protein n=1 Tax=Ferirhizobium litorale TaxID=2927786 RepID=UPI0024B31E07|nr:hypothetical protein [Fererhizobium litorale]MDI7865190.1 hypothetical protein [Fererhizobium litorale]